MVLEGPCSVGDQILATCMQSLHSKPLSYLSDTRIWSLGFTCPETYETFFRCHHILKTCLTEIVCDTGHWRRGNLRVKLSIWQPAAMRVGTSQWVATCLRVKTQVPQPHQPPSKYPKAVCGHWVLPLTVQIQSLSIITENSAG